MKNLLLGFVLMAGLVSAQVMVCQVTGGPVAGIVAAGGENISLFANLGGSFDPATCDFIPTVTQSVFDEAYWASQPAAIKALHNDPNAWTDAMLLKTNAAVAPLVDFSIMVWQTDPYFTMLMRIQYGYTYVPNAFQANIVAGPGINFPGFPVYNPVPPFPVGSIKVSLNLNDYPNATPPPPPPPTNLDPVGVVAYGNIYYTGSGFSTSAYPNGSVYTDTRGTFSLSCVVGLAGIGQSCYWQLTAPPVSAVRKPLVKKAAVKPVVKK